MTSLKAEIEEVTFHITGMRAIINVLAHSPPTTDPALMRTLSYSLMAMVERRDILRAVHTGIDV